MLFIVYPSLLLAIAYLSLVTCNQGQNPHLPEIPIVFSPIFLFDANKQPYQPSETPSAQKFFFPALNAARWASPNSTIYVIINFTPIPSDQKFLEDLNIVAVNLTTIHNPHIRQKRDKLFQACVLTKDNFFTLFGVERWYYVQELMKYFSLDMIFTIEVDNLMLRSIEDLEQMYEPRKYHFTHPYVSAHFSFMSYHYLHALNAYTTKLAHVHRLHSGKCPYTGGGQDMRLLYEGARYLQYMLSERYVEDFSHIKHHLYDKRLLNESLVLNTDVVLPCGPNNTHLLEKEWVYGICPKLDINGPCEKELNIAIDTVNRMLYGNTSYYPKIYECDEINLRASTSEHIYLGYNTQLNVKDKVPVFTAVKGTPMPTVNFKLSEDWRCPQRWAERYRIFNVQLFFRDGHAYARFDNQTLTPAYYTDKLILVELVNLHFQGGGDCKGQMGGVMNAAIRSKGDQRLSTCESIPGYGFPARNLPQVDHCLLTGEGTFYL
jgi:hypothetical protein